MLMEHDRNYGLGMDALVSVCFLNMNAIMVWAWMLWLAHAPGTRTEFPPQENPPHTPRVGFVPRRNANRAPTTTVGLYRKYMRVYYWGYVGRTEKKMETIILYHNIDPNIL